MAWSMSRALFSPHLAHYDALGFMRRAALISWLMVISLPLRIGVSCLQAHKIGNLRYLQFSRIFNGNYPLTGGYEG